MQSNPSLTGRFHREPRHMTPHGIFSLNSQAACTHYSGPWPAMEFQDPIDTWMALVSTLSDSSPIKVIRSSSNGTGSRSRERRAWSGKKPRCWLERMPMSTELISGMPYRLEMDQNGNLVCRLLMRRMSYRLDSICWILRRSSQKSLCRSPSLES